MSAQLSRRFARVAHLEPLSSLSAHEHGELDRLAFQLREFAELPAHYQQRMLAAEATRERLESEREASTPA
jgi:hypothetical protein